MSFVTQDGFVPNVPVKNAKLYSLFLGAQKYYTHFVYDNLIKVLRKILL
jgi:hypothetical protein